MCIHMDASSNWKWPSLFPHISLSDLSSIYPVSPIFLSLFQPTLLSFPRGEQYELSLVSVSLYWHGGCLLALNNSQFCPTMRPAAAASTLSVCGCVQLLARLPSFPVFTQLTSLLGPGGIHLASASDLFLTLTLWAHLYCFTFLSLLISPFPSSLCHCLPIRLSPPGVSPLTAKADCLFENGLWLWVKATAWVVIDLGRREREHQLLGL